MSVLLWVLSNWRVVALTALIAVPSLYAAVMKHQRDAARATVGEMVVAARLQEERTKAEIERQQLVTKGIEDEHKNRVARLGADAQRLRSELQQYASRSVVPAVPDPAGSGDDHIACFDRGALNGELEGVLQRLAERFVGIAIEGEGVSAAFAACSGWAIGEDAKREAATAR